MCGLGVELDENLESNDHIEMICKKAAVGIGMVKRIKPMFPPIRCKQYTAPKSSRTLVTALWWPIAIIEFFRKNIHFQFDISFKMKCSLKIKQK